MNTFADVVEQIAIIGQMGMFGITIRDVLIACGVFFLFVVARRLFFKFVLSFFKAMTRRTKTIIDDLLLETIEKPIEGAFVILGLYVAGQLLPLSEEASDVLYTVVRSLIAFVVFWALVRALDPLSLLFDRAIGLFGSAGMHETMKGFFVKLAKAIVICLGTAAVLQEWGFNVAAVLGSLGLVGMAVALGAREFIANMFAGLTIFMDRMFEKGNWIKTPDIEGNVEDIGFRATKVRRFDKALVTIPNSRLAGDALINYSRMTQRRIYWTIGLEYRTTQEQLRAIVNSITTYIQGNADFETDRAKVPTFIFVDSFGPSSIDVMLYCFTKTTRWGEWLAVKETLAYKIKEIVEEHAASFAFPSRSIYVETLPFGKPEPFQIPAEQQVSGGQEPVVEKKRQ
ncbi:MAG: mechanosensitive ion channel [Nitrospirales bacterium]|nr:mechanosensitive ion channel [Nitrospirales bacterium]